MDMEYLEPDFGDEQPTTTSETVAEKPEKLKEPKKPKKSIFEMADISSFTPAESVALLRRHIKKALPLLSDLELDELALKEIAFGPVSKCHGKVSDLETYFTKVAVPEWKDIQDHRKPIVLILASSAIRCVDLLKGFSGLRGKVTIAKLFAKHFKIAEQKAFLATHPSPIAIGTPARILKLGQDVDRPIELKVVTHLIIDTWQDGKDRTIFDVPEVRKELVDLLRLPELLSRLNNGQAKIYFF